MNKLLILLGRLLFGSFALLACAVTSAHASATTYPQRAVRIIVPFSGGGGLDGVVRRLADRLGVHLKQPVLVDNKPGASGVVALSGALAAPAAGYTVVMTVGSFLILASLLQTNLSYAAERDLVPVSRFASTPLALTVPGTLPVTDLAGLVQLAKSQPGQLSYGSFGAGSSPHLAAELLRHAANIEVVHVPYPGGAPLHRAQLAGEVQFGFDGVGFERELLQSGKLKLLAFAVDRRTPLAPNVPTFAELGYADFVVNPQIGIAARSGTPAERILRLTAAINAVLQAPSFQAAANEVGYEPAEPAPPDAYWKELSRDRAIWASQIDRVKFMPN